MNKMSAENKAQVFQYINTAILTLIGAFTMIIFVSLSNIKKSQEAYAGELVRLKTVQDINVASVKDIDARVSTLELNYLDYIKSWVDLNYVRKPQD
jgi:hypothetical protein